MLWLFERLLWYELHFSGFQKFVYNSLLNCKLVFFNQQKNLNQISKKAFNESSLQKKEFMALKRLNGKLFPSLYPYSVCELLLRKPLHMSCKFRKHTPLGFFIMKVGYLKTHKQASRVHPYEYIVYSFSSFLKYWYMYANCVSVWRKETSLGTTWGGLSEIPDS